MYTCFRVSQAVPRRLCARSCIEITHFRSARRKEKFWIVDSVGCCQFPHDSQEFSSKRHPSFLCSADRSEPLHKGEEFQSVALSNTHCCLNKRCSKWRRTRMGDCSI